MSALPLSPLPLLAQSDLLTGLLPLLGIALITLALMMMLRKRKRNQATEPTAREQLERLKQKQAMRGDLEHLMVELEQLTRRFNAQLDAKSLQLEKLTDQADRRIAELKRLQGEPRETPGAGAEHPDEPDQPAQGGVSAGDERASASWPARSVFEPKPRPAPSAGGPRAVTAAPDDAEDALTRRVYALADEGHAAVEIARQLDEHVGKIELMLALRKA